MFGANKNPEAQATQKLERFAVAITVDDKEAERPAEAGQLAQFVFAVVHVPTWAKA